jgi:hypothetical protein
MRHRLPFAVDENQSVPELIPAFQTNNPDRRFRSLLRGVDRFRGGGENMHAALWTQQRYLVCHRLTYCSELFLTIDVFLESPLSVWASYTLRRACS